MWGVVANSSLLLGAVIGVRAPLSQRTIGLCLALGAGALISALSFELAEDALERGGVGALAVGLAVGALGFFAGNAVVERRGARARMSPDHEGSGAAGGLALGALLDGIPESAALGMTLVTGGEVGLALVAAIFLSNIPESLASAANMRMGGSSARHVLLLWLAIASVCVVACLLGYTVLGNASESLSGGILAFAAGAVLAMLSETMFPEAYEHGGQAVGLVTVFGFALALLISETQA